VRYVKHVCASRGLHCLPSRRSLVLAGALVAAAPAAADVIHLKTGRSIEGASSPGAKKGTIEVRKADGVVVVLLEADIVRIEKKEDPASELERRLRAVPPDEVEPLLDLLGWAREKSLHREAKGIARRIIDIDPNDEAARKELGYVVYENKWILESELRKRKGLVRFRDEWMEAAEKERRLLREAAKEVEDLFELVESENPYIQSYAVQRILARREPALRETFRSRLRDPREAVRMVALGGLANLPVAGEGDAEARKIAADVQRVFLEDSSEGVLQVARVTLRKFYPRESYRLARDAASAAATPRERGRAAEIVRLLQP
jgi:hypothetical protein